MNVKEHRGCHGPSAHCWYCEDCTPGGKDGYVAMRDELRLSYTQMSHWTNREAAERACQCNNPKLTNQIRQKHGLPIIGNIDPKKESVMTKTYQTDVFTILPDDNGQYPEDLKVEGWFKLERPPLIVKKQTERPSDATHVYVASGNYECETAGSLVNHGDITYDTLRGTYDPTNHTIKLNTPLEVDYEPTSKYTPPPTRFTDNNENRKADKAEVSALRRTLLAVKDWDKVRFINAVSPLRDENRSVSVSISTLDPDFDKAVAAAAEQVKFSEDTLALIEACKVVDFEGRKRTLRHLAHLFDISKGQTWLR